MNILGLPPNTIYAPFITNKEAAKDIEISQKLFSLSNEKKDFISAMIDLVKTLD